MSNKLIRFKIITTEKDCEDDISNVVRASILFFSSGNYTVSIEKLLYSRSYQAETEKLLSERHARLTEENQLQQMQRTHETFVF